ncbi:4-hydroxyphenylacetate 3-hydroxylase family protein [Nitratireductor sp. ZSWI3]|uniref:4-hydroxyphenylacetate 3-hydroxylase family protein n=1 Tax=Nitratireductor sp. ZSWI3 TaxID=2966359 RepID=UPI002150271E|nr:4-hydroxyphenylacetate 3-hydroxylase N-terminal domain-containing protein [Nitratireductor sp. ZSWI3]MCR4266641.1 4-hydroxyphenylacetate 3-monooxygenase [Nitratireductor sp. ZSWI3]
MVKTGASHIASLKDGRTLFIDGERVADQTSHPAFRNASRSAAGLYDHQADPANLHRMTFVSPTSGGRVNRLWQLPRDYRELVARRKAMEEWAELTCGMMGRSPDHVGSSLAGMYMGLSVYEANDPKRAKALKDYFHYARDADLYITYVIINPQADRSKATSDQPGEELVARVVDEDHEGITIHGAKMLGTGAPFANEIMVSGFMGLQPGEEKFAFTAMLPMATRGLKLFSRKSYEASAPSVFDNPLASQFDENDAVVFFDQVKIPWERVLVNQDVQMAQAQWHETRAHVIQNFQCQVRLMVKLRFLVGIARKVAEINGIINIPQVRETLGLIAAKAKTVEGLVYAMESAGERYGDYFVPNRSLLATSQVIAQTLYPEIIDHIRTLAGGGLIMLPSSMRDFAHPEIAEVIGKTQRSSVAGSEERVKFFKLAWDAVGSEFGSRHIQYEMFYSGPAFITRGHSFRFYEWDRARAMVDGFLDTYGLPETRPASAAV